MIHCHQENRRHSTWCTIRFPPAIDQEEVNIICRDMMCVCHYAERVRRERPEVGGDLAEDRHTSWKA